MAQIRSARNAGAVTPSDSTELSYTMLYIGTAGDVVVRLPPNVAGDAGDTVTFSNVPAGTVLPVAGDRVMAATTASDIVWMNG